VLQCSFAQVVFFGDGLEHSARIHRSELTQTNLSNAVRDVIHPDFPIPFSCRSAQLVIVAISFGFRPRATAQFLQVQQCPALGS
jgi:hypothetical protein